MEMNLSKQDLVNMICGTSPSNSLIQKYYYNDYGVFRLVNGTINGWMWFPNTLLKLSESELVKIYNQCK